MKKVYIHIGSHKTASTYLQGLIAYNSSLLKKIDVDYPYPDQKKTVELGMAIGNTVRIAYKKNQVKIENNHTKIELNKIISDEIIKIAKNSTYKKIIFSGEFLWKADKKNINYLVENLNKFSEVIVICYLRDTFDHYLSMWKQNIKVNATNNKFSQFVNNYTNKRSFYGDLMHWDYKTKFVLINYDFHKKNIESSFFDLIGKDIKSRLKKPTLKKHNVSPSYAQINYLDKIPSGSINHTKYKILYSIKHEKETFYDRDLHKLILKKNIKAINQINKKITGEALVTKLRGKNYFQETNIEYMQTEFFSFEKNYAEAKKNKSFFNIIINTIYFLINRNFPLDFVPSLYEFLNDDVKRAPISARNHYLNNGIKENRQYK